MRRFIKPLYLPVLMLLLATAACSGGEANVQDVGTQNASAQNVGAQNVAATPTIQPTLPVNSDNVPLVARVNGQDITRPEFERALARRQLEATASDQTALENAVLDTLIEQVLIDQAAGDLAVTISDTDIDTELNTNIELAGGEAAWKSWLEQNLYTEVEFRETLRSMLITNRVLASVTEDLSGSVRQVHARHILVSTQEEAQDVLARLQAGEDFAALAGALSKDVTSKDQGGDLGWFTEGELLEPALSQVAFSLLPGQIAGPVPTRLGYHIIQTMEFDERPVPPEKMATLVQIQFENWLQSLLENATIERYL